ncbi:unnamed protein product [Diplocarpon coronariae]
MNTNTITNPKANPRVDSDSNSTSDGGARDHAKIIRPTYLAVLCSPHQPQPQPHFPVDYGFGHNHNLNYNHNHISTLQSSNQQHFKFHRHENSSRGEKIGSAASSSLFNALAHQNSDPGTMSLSYESRTFPDYPQSAMMHDPQQEPDDGSMQHHRYPSPPPPSMGENPYSTQHMDATAGLNLDEMPELPVKDGEEALSPGRSKPVQKPFREETKGDDGRFLCNWVGCTEDVRSFNRKCEWSKHMDKHDRPYKCDSEGCEKLPGFTYSGGLLRHQREVHNLHGGPRKQLNCPHLNCKRFSGKGFSRQENLNEHLRRVHTDASEVLNAEETEEEGSERAGMKRKRPTEDGVYLRMEMARLRSENDELRKQAELQTSQTNELMRSLQTLQQIVGARIQQNAPQATHQAPQATMM